MEFANKTVVITGAAGNLGQVVAKHFSSAGANLILLDIDAKRLGLVARSLSDASLAIETDLLCRDDTYRAIHAVVEQFGRVDVLCNVAGGFRMGEAVHESSDDTWNRLFDLNVRTLLNAVRATVPAMIGAGAGKVVNVSASAALSGAASMGPYCATKSIVQRLTESMSAELRPHNINVNCVLPTIIDTPDNREAMPDVDPSRWIPPDDIARTILFLSSPDGAALHGASVPVSARH
jgi:NAD(P)-dependent dehydrogenase (short-subunit alcohol dehydrogenase family)